MTSPSVVTRPEPNFPRPVREADQVVGHHQDVAGLAAAIADPIVEQCLDAKTEPLECRTCAGLVQGEHAAELPQTERLSKTEGLGHQRAANPDAPKLRARVDAQFADLAGPSRRLPMYAGVTNEFAFHLSENGGRMSRLQVVHPLRHHGGIGDISTKVEEIVLAKSFSEFQDRRFVGLDGLHQPNRKASAVG